MKRLFWSCLILVAMLLSACSPKTIEDPQLVYTQAAQTVMAQFTAIATLTPPTPTATLTPTTAPTETPSPTPEPSATATATWPVFPPGKATVPVLVYNSIADSVEDDPFYQWESALYVFSNEFEQQMRALSEAGYQTIPVSKLVEIINKGGTLPPKPVCITFDNNKLGTYRKVFPIMQKYGFTGTIFLASDQIDAKNVLTSAQIKEMMAAGWEIGSRGASGENLLDVQVQRPDTIGQEISGSRLDLEQKLGVPVTVFAYPGGAIDSEGRMVGRVQSWGYQAAVGLFKSSEHSLNTLFYIPRYEIRRGLPLTDFLTILPWQPEQPLSDATLNFLTPQPGGAEQPAPAATTAP